MTVAQLHPLDPLTCDEIAATSKLLRKAFSNSKIRFQQIEFSEPAKAELIPYLDAERLGQSLPAAPARRMKSYLWVYKSDRDVDLHKLLVNLTSGQIEKDEILPESVQAPIHAEEMIEMEQVCLANPAILKEIERLQLPKGYKVATDPWMYGTQDDTNNRRRFQCYMYVTLDVPDEADEANESNHYARPLDFSPVFDGHTHELVEIIRLPLGLDHTTSTGKDPWEAVSGCEYHADLTGVPHRTDLKPLLVKQPSGVSFQVDGHLVHWQKWQFRVAITLREGLVLHNVSYDGRQVLYRAAVNEMTVPYGDPRAPYHRKQAFDFGDVGMGLTANKLGLGCDCLGTVHYFSGFVSNGEGQAVEMPNVICMHEVDDGILWKHTNYRNERAKVVRNRKLVIQMVATVGNYEYIFAWELDLAGAIHMEMRATGILSTMPIKKDLINGTTEEGRANAKKLGFGTVVSEGTMAANHQHLFNVRIDPAVDGHRNIIVKDESVAMPLDEENPWGVGYINKRETLSRPCFQDLDISKARTFIVQNPTKFNKISGKPVGYKLHAHASQMMLMHPNSYSFKRAYFAQHPICITKYRDGELYAAGEFTNQSIADTGLFEWTKRDEELDTELGDDVVLWHTFSLSHSPRPEDFPVMPAEVIKMSLKPTSFFDQNPANDCVPSSQSINQSVLAGLTNGCC
ncbi:copper amine oxidase [Protomyces lactucae-debilis]|uniref:Amine oxidase n=1 Tax=Protomyces lactucae-debilis TaxID=2754530 RepID=A0A1Y2FI97_PROLT|nr:copper amine oxidase [Protomyces lactucae-debilis]ORY83671.1 copper amine oxidase [Protomyces lactucae-debilis]